MMYKIPSCTQYYSQRDRKLRKLQNLTSIFHQLTALHSNVKKLSGLFFNKLSGYLLLGVIKWWICPEYFLHFRWTVYIQVHVCAAVQSVQLEGIGLLSPKDFTDIWNASAPCNWVHSINSYLYWERSLPLVPSPSMLFCAEQWNTIHPVRIWQKAKGKVRIFIAKSYFIAQGVQSRYFFENCAFWVFTLGGGEID